MVFKPTKCGQCLLIFRSKHGAQYDLKPAIYTECTKARYDTVTRTPLNYSTIQYKNITHIPQKYSRDVDFVVGVFLIPYACTTSVLVAAPYNLNNIAG